jgi:hypothetical protein
MKKFKFMFFVSTVLLPLGMASCASLPKLDVSTLDPSQPVPVEGISLVIPVNAHNSFGAKFYAKYGEGLRTTSDQLQTEDAETLLEILCGSVVENWDYIVESVKENTGLTLDGEELMQDLEYGDSYRVIIQRIEEKGLNNYMYSWSTTVHESPIALVALFFDFSSETIIPIGVSIEAWDGEKHGGATYINPRMTSIKLKTLGELMGMTR